MLWDYVRSILLPVGATLGVVQDDYPLSRSLLDPPATLVAILAWVAVLWVALSRAGRQPALSAGVLLFLAGHAMESTLWPLEIRFDHRNYLPALGVLQLIKGLGGVNRKKGFISELAFFNDSQSAFAEAVRTTSKGPHRDVPAEAVTLVKAYVV